MKKRHCLLLMMVFFFNTAHALEPVTISWRAPKSYTDGERLEASRDLSEYRLYYGDSPETIRDHVVHIPSQMTSYKITAGLLESVKSAIIYFAMTSVAKNGLESDLSKSVFYLP